MSREHSDRSDPGKRVKTTLPYCPLATALKPYSWGSLTRVQTKDLNPAVVFATLGPCEVHKCASRPRAVVNHRAPLCIF